LGTEKKIGKRDLVRQDQVSPIKKGKRTKGGNNTTTRRTRVKRGKNDHLLQGVQKKKKRGEWFFEGVSFAHYFE